MPPSRFDPDLIRQLGIKDEAIRAFIESIAGLMPSTRYHYTRDLEFAQCNMKRGDLLQWGPKDVQAYFRFLSVDLQHSPRTVKRRMVSLSRLYTYHEKKGRIAEHPVKKAVFPRLESNSTRPVFLNLEEMCRFLSYQRSTFDPAGESLEDLQGIQGQSIVTTLPLTGVRVEKLTSLTLDDFRDLDTEFPYLAVFGAKGGTHRTISLHPLVVSTYKAWLRVRPKTTHSVCYINLRTGNPLSSRTVQRYVRKIAQQAGIDKPITPHKLRHTFATLLMTESNASLKDIQELLGHKSPDTTMIYLHTDLRRARQLVNKLTFDF